MRGERRRVALGLAALTLLALPFADLRLGTHDPWPALARMAAGFLRPDLGAVDGLGRALALTVAFAVAGVSLGAAAGLALAPFHGHAAVRLLCIALRSVHELFWALLLMQAFGIAPATGVLAIALPYAGIFAKVVAERLDEADPRPARLLGPRVDPLSRFLWGRAPLALAPLRSYALYRLECGLRSSAVLGFIGLPTLGFQLESAFSEGQYGAAGAILVVTVALIATIRLGMRPGLLPLWLGASALLLALVPHPPVGDGALRRFLTEDIVPAPLREGGGGLPELLAWAGPLLRDQALPGLWATLVLGQVALGLTALVALLSFGVLVPRATGRAGRLLGHLLLVVLRSVPEYMLAFLALQALGPSMLPAILALGLHNGAIIAHLLGREGAALLPALRRDAPRGLTLWAWELVPRLWGPFLALLLYRWEIILRDTAVMGLLGIATLGFWVEGAVAELRLDRALLLLVAGGLLTAGVDALSRGVRRRLGPAQARAGSPAPGGADGPRGSRSVGR